MGHRLIGRNIAAITGTIPTAEVGTVGSIGGTIGVTAGKCAGCTEIDLAGGSVAAIGSEKCRARWRFHRTRRGSLSGPTVKLLGSATALG
jgi:hypothetical protein